MTKNHPLPPPDMSGTDPDAVLRRRISIPDPTTSTPAPTPPAPVHTQVDLGVERVREGREGKGSRPDPAGMRRTSLYITKEAADGLEAAADQVLAILGGDTPRHVALSALLMAGVGQAQTVARQLAEQQAAELSTRLAALQQASGG
jgi:hypothetical protein